MLQYSMEKKSYVFRPHFAESNNCFYFKWFAFIFKLNPHSKKERKNLLGLKAYKQKRGTYNAAKSWQAGFNRLKDYGHYI